VLAVQWVVGWPYLWARRRTVALGVAVPTAYLSGVDAVAIHEGVWRLAPEYTTGLAPGGLPVEEATFFGLTTLFVVQGLVLYPWVVRRWT
jgi:lycopene cyclase domain-containing protein